MRCGWKQRKTWIDPKTKSRSGDRLAARTRRKPIHGGFAAASLPLRVLAASLSLQKKLKINETTKKIETNSD
jgi:hypothetical protein